MRERTARAMLVTDEAASLPWAAFDPAWYGRRYPDAADALRDYLERGVGLRRSPNRFFDEAWYLDCYADVAAAVAAGAYESGFDHYFRTGHSDRSPHWLFDEQLYRARYPDLTDVVLAAAGFANGYDHYLKHGDREDRSGHALFDPARYRAGLAPEARAAAAAIGSFAHFLAYLVDAPDEPSVSDQFDPDLYRARHPEAVAEIAAGRCSSALEHFLRRVPGGGADRPGRYREAVIDVPEPLGKSLFRARALAFAPLWGRAPLDFTTETPDLSVVMVLHDQFALTMMALASLRANYVGGIELILVDSGSADETRHVARYVRGARVLRFEANIGFVRGCNAALYSVTTDRVLFLNTDVELGPGAVGAALRRLDSDPRIGATGGRIVRSHGLLQEAGCIVWRDGTTSGYLRDASPLAPEANFVRDVDFCSGAFLMVRGTVLAECEGFDEAFAPAYYEETDLCVRIAQAGYRVVYDPAIVVHHLEYGSAGKGSAAEAQIARGRGVFAAKHAGWLAAKPPQGETLLARDTRALRRVLLIEDTLPLRMLGSGFVRSNDIVAAMTELGFAVTVYPITRSDADPAAIYAAFGEAVEVMHDRDVASLPAFLAERAGYYETVWIVRTHNLRRVLPAIEAMPGPAPRLVLDTEAIAARREASRAELAAPNAPFDLAGALREELAHASRCDALVAVNAAEAALLGDAGFGPVHILGHRCSPAPTPRGWAEREGMLFLGAIHDAASPNYDALAWFFDAVLPLVEAELGWRTRLTVAGHLGPGVSLARFAAHPRVTLLGAVADTTQLYDAHRVFVAPTRAAAGLPYTVHEAASLGLPVVATDLIARQLGWAQGEELMAASATDPASFADAVVALTLSQTDWSRVRDAALARVARENAAGFFADALRVILD